MDNSDKYWIVTEEPFSCDIVSMADQCKETMEAWNELPQPRYEQKESYDKLIDVYFSLMEKPVLEPGLATVVLFAVVQNSPEDSRYLDENMDIYMRYIERNIPEFCREVVLRDLKHMSKSDLSNQGQEYVEVIKEDKNTHVADILGMIVDELQEKGVMTDCLYEELVNELKEYIIQWRELDVPKTEAKEAYSVMRAMEEICFKYRAYRTCLILSPMYMISGKDCQNHFDESVFFIGKVLYELGYREYARNCFQRVDANTNQACWSKEGEEKYKRLLNEETKLEVPQWVYDRDEDMQKKVQNGEAIIVSDEEADEMELFGTKRRKEEKSRERKNNNLLKKRIAAVSEQWEEFDASEGEALHRKAEELLEILGELGKNTEEVVSIYRRKGEEYLKAQDYKGAEQEFDKAYSFRMGRYDSKLMSDFAILAEHNGQKGRAKAYQFRAKILLPV